MNSCPLTGMLFAKLVIMKSVLFIITFTLATVCFAEETMGIEGSEVTPEIRDSVLPKINELAVAALTHYSKYKKSADRNVKLGFMSTPSELAKQVRKKRKKKLKYFNKNDAKAELKSLIVNDFESLRLSSVQTAHLHISNINETMPYLRFSKSDYTLLVCDILKQIQEDNQEQIANLEQLDVFELFEGDSDFGKLEALKVLASFNPEKTAKCGDRKFLVLINEIESQYHILGKSELAESVARIPYGSGFANYQHNITEGNLTYSFTDGCLSPKSFADLSFEINSFKRNPNGSNRHTSGEIQSGKCKYKLEDNSLLANSKPVDAMQSILNNVFQRSTATQQGAQ